MSRYVGRHAKKSKRKFNKHLLFLSSIVIIGSLIGVYYLFSLTESTASSQESKQEESSSTSVSSSSQEQEQSTTKESDPLDAANYDNLLSNQEIVTDEGASYDQKILSSGFIGSALIVKNGKILLHKGYGYADKAADVKNTPSTFFNICSMQKGLTAVLVMKAVKEGKLSLTDTLAKYYPNVPNASTITIQQLLQMASGLKLTQNPSGTEDVRNILNWDATHITSTGTQGIFDYSPVNYNLLAGILGQVTGQDYDTLLNDFYMKQNGFKQTLLYQDFLQLPTPTVNYKTENEADPYVTPNEISRANLAAEAGTGNLYMSVGEVYHYYDLLLNNKLLDATTLKQMWTPVAGSSYAAGFYDRGTYYRAHGGKGGFESFGLFTKDNKTSVILLSNRSRKSDTELMNQLYNPLANTNVSF
jgi:CubicO group peptidase (beta-lactamase class C family)